MADPERRTVAVVEDDVEVGRLIARILAEYRFEVHRFERGRDFLRRCETIAPALAILDLGLPDIDGLELVREASARGIPAIVLTGRGGVADRVLGLELGADDYLVKPFEPRELVARVNSVLRRSGGRQQQVAPSVALFAGWRFDPDNLTLTSPEGKPVRLSRAEAQLLELFVRAPNRVLTRDYLFEARASASAAFDRSIDVRISRLRHKLDDDPHNPRFIRTVYGAGYLFSGPVSWCARDDRAPP